MCVPFCRSFGTLLCLSLLAAFITLPFVQVVVSSDVYEAISASTAALGYEFTSKDLGTQQLRGLPSAMDLVQLTPARFSERTFPPLRLEKAGDVEDDDGDDVESISSGGTSVRGVSWPRAMEREVVIHPIVRNGTMSVEEGIALAYNTYYSIHALLCLTKGDARKKVPPPPECALCVCCVCVECAETPPDMRPICGSPTLTYETRVAELNAIEQAKATLEGVVSAAIWYWVLLHGGDPLPRAAH